MTLGNRLLVTQAVSVAVLVVISACGSSSPTSPSGGSGSGVVVRSTGSVGAVGATITIGANGSVSPSQVTVAVNQSVTFVNNDSKTHEMASNPHPQHTDCPSIANIGILSPNQSKTTFGFANAGTCGYHDHQNPDTASLKGTIVVQ